MEVDGGGDTSGGQEKWEGAKEHPKDRGAIRFEGHGQEEGIGFDWGRYRWIA
jgi:hypothetical protein